jgi:hypothetical protein
MDKQCRRVGEKSLTYRVTTRGAPVNYFSERIKCVVFGGQWVAGLSTRKARYFLSRLLVCLKGLLEIFKIRRPSEGWDDGGRRILSPSITVSMFETISNSLMIGKRNYS